MGIAVPLQLGAIGLPLLACDLLSGILLILPALFLFFLCRKKLSGQADNQQHANPYLTAGDQISFFFSLLCVKKPNNINMSGAKSHL
jgi:hypothetical protein